MKYGFLRTAAVSPALHVADCAYNTQQIIAAMRHRLLPEPNCSACRSLP